MRSYEAALEKERADRRARGRRADAIWKNICFEHPELRARPPVTTSTRPATADRKASSAPWAVREMHSDGRYEWYRASGNSESEARALAERLRRTSAGKVEAMQMGGGRSGRTTR